MLESYYEFLDTIPGEWSGALRLNLEAQLWAAERQALATEAQTEVMKEILEVLRKLK